MESKLPEEGGFWMRVFTEIFFRGDLVAGVWGGEIFLERFSLGGKQWERDWGFLSSSEGKQGEVRYLLEHFSLV